MFEKIKKFIDYTLAIFSFPCTWGKFEKINIRSGSRPYIASSMYHILKDEPEEYEKWKYLCDLHAWHCSKRISVIRCTCTVIFNVTLGLIFILSIVYLLICFGRMESDNKKTTKTEKSLKNAAIIKIENCEYIVLYDSYNNNVVAITHKGNCSSLTHKAISQCPKQNNN